MKIEVFDVAAERAGALTILLEFYEAAVQSPEHEWIFHVSKPELPPTSNVRVFSHPWVKRSWFHRIAFEAVANKLVRKNRPDVVLSLQNIAVWGTDVNQVVYIHQSLPYAHERYRVLREPRLWAYQNVISVLINRSIMKASLIIVQSQWMKEIIEERLHVESDKISVIPPEAPTRPALPDYQITPAVRHYFFYPSSFRPYKNHKIIVDACRLLQLTSDRDFRVELTVSPTALKRLKVDQLQCISNSGPLTFEEVQRRYSRSVLLYPSKLESYALPLAEARRAGAIILAADTPFGREVLDGYPNARLFADDDAPALARYMQAVMDGSLAYVKSNNDAKPPTKPSAEAIESIVRIGKPGGLADDAAPGLHSHSGEQS